MSQIDALWSNSYSEINRERADDISTTNQQLFPATTPLTAQVEEGAEASLMETMESMGLVMGSRLLQGNGRKDDDKDKSTRLYEMLLKWVPRVEGGALVELVTGFSTLGNDPGDVVEQMREGGVPEGAMVLLLASLLADPQIERKRRRRLEDALTFLLDDEAISIDLLAWVELGNLPRDALLPLRQIYQQIRQRDDDEAQQEKGLAGWFNEVREWPDRRTRLRVLIRALALDLRADADHHPVKVVTALGELKRLLLFFSMEDHCASVAFSVGVEPERMLAEVLHLLEQTWIYPDWLEQRIGMMGISGSRIFTYLRQMQDLLRFMPSPCFQDDDQAVQLAEAFEQLQEQHEDQCDG
ncbi:TyeA family type III secretion system gatekeeper subunit [Enterobacteriaceae bacterium H20N1]|uniref:TyeA family type III secretion system gatekeeper subunit n=1 Tax=Dryocola boscaweniae TaxID=2925397 RepID=A0A9X3ALY3_9ENTR|nr:TyeA family type III secretion system gatekeeper subunit [Dryocola boscaweniae]MCT4700522.1 TyeA family type III secretion system gatekeeper subunit [Dryocola boscaweniae]MCT4717678.1 TyeA family type III secretion system gatekeeper subunit [Dryocola boscaweniae]